MNMAVVKSYWRSIQRGTRTLEDVPEPLREAVSKLDTLTGKLQALERNLLQYAEKLGLTPSGRVRLAQKRAQAAAPEPDDDLFGD